MRIDHFRGFEAYWQIPASEATAVKGEWIPGPRDSFFDAISAALGSSLPIIAEDLGLITPGVVALRDKYNLPGMKVLQFAFHENNDDPFLPHNHIPNCVVYTGTHDNNTTIGWWRTGEATRAAKRSLTRYVGHKIEHANWELIRVGMASPAHTFIIPFQDIISADQRARMNTPGSASGNWSWRFAPAALEGKSKARLAQWTQFFARGPKR
jgi:4-alpha-glucanotransferase